MELTVISPPLYGGAGRSASLTPAGLLKPGQALSARVVQLQADGTTLLDFGRFRAVVETDPRWRPGDLLRLLVASGAPGASVSGESRMPIRLLLTSPAAGFHEDHGRSASNPPLPPCGGRTGGAAGADPAPDAASLHPKTGALRWNRLLETFAGWVARRSAAAKLGTEAPADRMARLTDGSRGGDGTGRPAAASDIDQGPRDAPPTWQQAFEWDGGQVMLKILERPAAGRREGARARASILAVTRHLGPVRVDLSWNGQGTGISFFVAAEATARCLRAELGDLRQSLEACGQSVQLRVTVSPSRIEAFALAERNCRGRRISARGV